MTSVDPIIPKLLKIRKKSEERRLAALLREIRVLEQKRRDLVAERAQMETRQDGYSQMSVEHGYLRYMAHRDAAIVEQIAVLKAQADEVQAALKRSVFSQSALGDTL